MGEEGKEGWAEKASYNGAKHEGASRDEQIETRGLRQADEACGGFRMEAQGGFRADVLSSFRAWHQCQRGGNRAVSGGQHSAISGVGGRGERGRLKGGRLPCRSGRAPSTERIALSIRSNTRWGAPSGGKPAWRAGTEGSCVPAKARAERGKRGEAGDGRGRGGEREGVKSGEGKVAREDGDGESGERSER